MRTEIEAKFLSVGIDRIRKKLDAAGATLEVPMRMMSRVLFEGDDKSSYVRLRDEGDKTTLTYKRFDELSVDGAKEIEVEVGGFETTLTILEKAGLKTDSYQESKRETWILDEVEVVIDQWPWLDPYIEIEGLSEQAVKDVAQKLGFDWNEAVFGDVSSAYAVQYARLPKNLVENIGEIGDIRFDMEKPKALG